MQRERPTPEQLGRIDQLAEQLGLDSLDLFQRVRRIVGRPVPASTSTLDRDEAAVVIADLELDNLQPTLPYDLTQEQTR